MKKIVMMLCILAVVTITSADVIRGIDIDFVTIGNAGNAAQATGNGSGAVGYDYRIGKYEVTNAQWNVFTSAVGAPTGNLSNAYDESATYTDAQQPTNGVSWYEAVQFCNYLTSGDKSKGSYRWSGNNANPGDFLGIDRSLAEDTYGTAYFLPTEDEWHKAAYYKPDDSGYSHYANGTNTIPVAGVDTNYDGVVGHPWSVGSGTEEQNGTFNMMGNVWEWNETVMGDMIVDGTGIRGEGCRGHGGLASTDWGGENAFAESQDIGFRIASVPEPCSLLLISCGCLFLRKRKS